MAISFLTSCGNPLELEANGGRTQSSLGDYFNTGKSLTYSANPVVLSGNANRSSGSFADLNLEPKFITSNQTLTEKCFFTQNTSAASTAMGSTANDCIRVLLNNNPNTVALNSVQDSWNYPVDSDEFIQVNTFFHLKKLVQEFHKTLSFSHKFVHFGSMMTLPPATPTYLKDTKTFWLSENGLTQTLTAFAKCEIEPMNAFFDPSNNELCFGWNQEYSRYHFYMAQDPSVIYHELGHALIKTMMNQRNLVLGFPTNSYKPFQSSLGSLFYDEGGAINEGLADYFAYYMLGRSRVGEWSMGRFFNAARPVREADSLHTVNVAETFDKRLSYPNFLQYDPNDTTKNYEDVHHAGQIVSHYFVALTESLKSSCTFPTSGNYSRVSLKHEHATNYVMTLINETLAEMGDLYAKGSDLSEINFANLNENHSYLWTQLVNPPNMKRFMQSIAKNINAYISDGLCPEFTVDHSEQLLDSYGLLLFKKYKDEGISSDGTKKFNDITKAPTFAGRSVSSVSVGTSVNELNRKKSVLISKSFIDLPTDRSIAYVFDSQSAIRSILSNLTFEGANVRTTEGLAGTEYNNNNVLISPGEVVGVSLNLVNNSNSTMAGVQVLANDFDHMKIRNPSSSYVNREVNRMDATRKDYISYYDPCTINSFPTVTEGGKGSNETSTLPDQCNYTSRSNDQLFLVDTMGSTTYPYYAPDAPQPVCFIQKLENNQTTWVSQDEFRVNAGLEDHECLNNPSMSNDKFNPNECMMRFLPGANQAILGKIDPQKTWGETLQGNGSAAPVFNQSTILLMEVNKWVPPGTTFNCRMRVRYSNCSDCYTDTTTGNEYPDFEYAGHKPFKIINFKFTVTQ